MCNLPILGEMAFLMFTRSITIMTAAKIYEIVDESTITINEIVNIQTILSNGSQTLSISK